MADADFATLSVVPILRPIRPRKLSKVPFVELADGRLQGVVSSGSDIGRVYVSSIAVGTHTFSCSTNNNRPCGGARGTLCKHLQSLVAEAVLQYGFDRVVRYLKVVVGDEHTSTPHEVIAHMDGEMEQAPAGIVFSRFLAHLRYLELPTTTAPVPEMQWFPAIGVSG